MDPVELTCIISVYFRSLEGPSRKALDVGVDPLWFFWNVDVQNQDGEFRGEAL
jgi:hypothetical protein